MGLDLSNRCKKCGKLIEPGDMRALPDGKGFVCVSCYEDKTPGFNPLRKERLRTPSEHIVRAEDQITDVDDSAKIDMDEFFSQKQYVCDSCNYTFKRNPETKVNVCPFCGKTTVHEKVEIPTQDSLD